MRLVALHLVIEYKRCSECNKVAADVKGFQPVNLTWGRSLANDDARAFSLWKLDWPRGADNFR